MTFFEVKTGTAFSIEGTLFVTVECNFGTRRVVLERFEGEPISFGDGSRPHVQQSHTEHRRPVLRDQPHERRLVTRLERGNRPRVLRRGHEGSGSELECGIDV